MLRKAGKYNNKHINNAVRIREVNSCETTNITFNNLQKKLETTARVQTDSLNSTSVEW